MLIPVRLTVILPLIADRLLEAALGTLLSGIHVKCVLGFGLHDSSYHLQLCNEAF